MWKRVMMGLKIQDGELIIIVLHEYFGFFGAGWKSKMARPYQWN